MSQNNPFKAPLYKEVQNNNEQKRKLNAKSAVLIFASYLGIQILSGIIAGIVFAVYFAAKNSGFNSEEFQLFFKGYTLPILIFSLLSSGFIMLALSLKYGKDLIKDTSTTGIALNTGKTKNLLFSIFLGILIALLYSSFAVFIYPPDPDAEVGPLTQMLITPGPTRIFWIFLALFFAPFVEEFLFRGVMIAGFAYSYGITRAAIIVTFLFVVIHSFEAIHYPPAFGGITLIAIVVLYLRLRYKSLGPPIAAHFGYNLVIASATFVGG